MGGFPSPRPNVNDKHNFLGIELEAPYPDGYDPMTKIFKEGKFAKNIVVQRQEGEVCCLIPQEDYKPCLKHIMDVRRRLGHYFNSPECVSAGANGCFVDPLWLKNERFKDSWDKFKYFSQPLEERQFEVGDHYGIHVHVDIRHRNKHDVLDRLNDDKAREALGEFRGWWRQQADKGRSTYGCKNTPHNLEREGYHTVEVRLLDANYDFDRTCGYIELILDIVDGHWPKRLKTTKPK